MKRALIIAIGLILVAVGCHVCSKDFDPVGKSRTEVRLKMGKPAHTYTRSSDGLWPEAQVARIADECLKEQSALFRSADAFPLKEQIMDFRVVFVFYGQDEKTVASCCRTID